MQYARYSTGGYVLHKLRGYWSGRVSAWFDAKGNLTAAEHILASGAGRDVPRRSPMWAAIQQYGGPLAHVLPAEPCGTTEFKNG